MNIYMSKEDSRDSLLHDASFQDDLRTALKRVQSQRDDHLQQRTPRGADNRRRRRQENLYNHCKAPQRKRKPEESYEDHTRINENG